MQRVNFSTKSNTLEYLAICRDNCFMCEV